jgi:hypothetical protein
MLLFNTKDRCMAGANNYLHKLELNIMFFGINRKWSSALQKSAVVNLDVGDHEEIC